MIGSTVIHLDIVDSTNNYAAKELLTKSLNEGTIIVAACQKAGRGTGLASWESAEGLNLTFTAVLYPSNVALSQQFSISQAISLGVSDYLSRFVTDVTVKWPNDIYVNDKKIGGILIETAITGGKFSRALVGIGLNINQEVFVSDAPNPVSLKNLTGKTYELSQMLTDLCNCLDNRYRSLIRGDYFILQHDYGKLLYRKGIWAKYNSGETDFEGRIIGVEVDGRLQIETRMGEVRGFYFKEVTFK
ncbi:MAG: biotin--[acetyl-CoA-carboxylase] ligase [Prolixibacteraceae bacterium]|jgi:BirA family biotin operon repressor/biotin-[acetyl-CoA-carboxylase] ligase|nr:biotin--[acetyl-CoA-carboxylase] ligase [Prolixibacteraceae bacterium]